MRLITDALLRKFPNTLEQDPKDVGVEIKTENMLDLKNIVERDYGVPITSQHYWAYITRINKTIRPSQYVRANDFRINDSTILFLYEKKGAIAQDALLVMMKRFDTQTMSLEHIGATLICAGTKLSQLKEAYLEKLEKSHGLTPDDLDCYEIINNLRVVKITYEEGVMQYDIDCGDCICFQPACQTPTFADMHILFSGNYLQMATKIYTPQDAFVTSHTRSLFNNKELSDVAIKIEDTTFHVNKCVLASIPYFKMLLFGSMKESTQSEIILKDVSVKGLEALLKYIYKVQEWCPKDDVQSLIDMLLLIDMYGVDDKLRAEVEAVIASKLTPDNVLTVVFAISKITAPWLKEKCTGMIEHNIYGVAKNSDFASFCAEHKGSMLEIMGRIQYKLSGRKPTLIIGQRATTKYN